jgi:hypothetical protein
MAAIVFFYWLLYDGFCHLFRQIIKISIHDWHSTEMSTLVSLVSTRKAIKQGKRDRHWATLSLHLQLSVMAMYKRRHPVYTLRPSAHYRHRQGKGSFGILHASERPNQYFCYYDHISWKFLLYCHYVNVYCYLPPKILSRADADNGRRALVISFGSKQSLTPTISLISV